MVLPPPEEILVIAIVIFFAIGLHEYAHCKAADIAGDPTPAFHGRVTLNLTKHFEPLGTLMILITSITGYGIGWGKPAPIDPRKMNNPRWDTFVAVAAGPLSNVIQAGIYAIFLRFAMIGGAFGPNLQSKLLWFGVMINLSLCFFNLIPLGPLDGHWLVGQSLPERPRYYWYRFNRTYGGMILLGVILVGQASGFSLVRLIAGPPVEGTFKFLTGYAPIELRLRTLD